MCAFFPPEPGTQPCDGGAQCPGRGFSDMPGPADWSHEGIDYAVSHGLFVGTFVSPTLRKMAASKLYSKMTGMPSR